MKPNNDDQYVVGTNNESSLGRVVATPISALVLGLITALVLTTTLNGFVGLKQIIAGLATQQNQATVLLSTVKNKISANSPILDWESQDSGRVIVKFKDEAKLPPGLSVASEKANLEKAQGLNKVLTINEIGATVYNISEEDTPSEVVQRIIAKHKDLIEYAEVDKLAVPALIPNDPYFTADSSWHLQKTDSPAAWDNVSGEGVIVAVLDSGVNCNNSELSANCVTGWNVVDKNSSSNDVNGHGTYVASTLASVGNNGIGGIGVAFSSKIMPIRLTNDSSNQGVSCSNIADGIVYAANNGVKVASNSYIVKGCSVVTDAANYMHSKGGIYVRAAGNSNEERNEFNYENVIEVSATDQNDAKAWFSNYGTIVDVSAPGVNVYCTYQEGVYGTCSGTSLSVPIVSGVLSLIFSANPTLTPTEAKSILFSSADDLGASGWDPYFGHGRVNAMSAVTMAMNTGNETGSSNDTQPPTIPSNLTANNVTESSVSLSWSPSTDDVLVAGYNIYRDNQKVSTISNSASYTDNNLNSNTNYSYTVSAVDGVGNESAKSDSVTVTTKDFSFDIASHSVVSKSNTDAVIEVNLTKAGIVTINYGTNANNLNQQVASTDSRTVHTLNLTGLSSRTTYYYQVTASVPGTGDSVVSSISSFKTSNGGGGKKGESDSGDTSGGGNNGKGNGKPIR